MLFRSKFAFYAAFIMKYLAIFTMLSAVAGDLDPRLPVSTLVREDIFAGLMAGDMYAPRRAPSVHLTAESK